MEISVEKVPQDKQKTLPSDLTKVAFGTLFTDHMFCMEWDVGKGWHSARIQPYQPLCLEPSAMIFHYGQEAFEGLKAYYSAKDRIVLFRPQENIARLNRTAKRMCLPELDSEFVLSALKQLLACDARWVPKEKGTSLYIRPTVIATEPALGVKQSKSFLFFIILSPVGPYFSQGFNPVDILVATEQSRACLGGTGDVKTAGNYAACTKTEKEAKEKGFAQVLWLDAKEKKYVEEVGSMNIFFVIDGELVTPELSGTILPGITRKSVLAFAQHVGIRVSERRVFIEDVLTGIENGSVTEIFGCGTAAVISPIGSLQYNEKKYVVNGGKTGVITQQLYDAITSLQSEQAEDPFNWIEVVE